LRVFWIAGRKDLSNWDYVVRLVRRWEDVEEILANRGPGPWFMAISDTAIRELTV